MNIFIVSTFDCTVEDFKEFIEEPENEKEIALCVAEAEVIEVNPHKAISLLNVTNLDLFIQTVTSPKYKKWDEENNSVSSFYRLEKLN